MKGLPGATSILEPVPDDLDIDRGKSLLWETGLGRSLEPRFVLPIFPIRNVANKKKFHNQSTLKGIQTEHSSSNYSRHSFLRLSQNGG